MMVILPNVIIQHILEYLLNCGSIKIDYLIDFTKVYTLVSKQWNREIISKLRIDGYLYLSKQILKNGKIGQWKDLAKRYKIDYRIKLTEYSDLEESLKEKVYSIKSLTSFNDEAFSSSYSNLKSIYFDFDKDSEYKKLYEYLSDSESNISKRLRENIELNINHYGENGDEYDYPNNYNLHFSEILFNRNLFKEVFISNIYRLEYQRSTSDKNNLNTKLEEFTLYKADIDSDALYHLLEISPNLKVLDIDQVKLFPKNDFTGVLEKISNSKFQYIEYLYLNLYSPVHYNSIVTLLNNIRSKDNNLLINGDILYDSVDQVLKSEIDNKLITSFRFDIIDNRFSPGSDQLNNFSLFNVWKDKSQLKTINMHLSIDLSNHLDSMINLESITVIKDPRDPGRQEHENISKILLLNIPSYTSLEFNSSAYFKHKDKAISYTPIILSDILLKNTSLTSFSINSMNTQECISLITMQHPTITNLKLGTKPRSVEDWRDLVTTIRDNHTITHLQITGSYFNEDIQVYYNIFDSLIQILSVNRTLFSLKLPTEGELQSHHIQSFKEILKSNTVIKSITLPYSSDTEYLSLKNLFNKFAIN
ncbi:hypothetical protein DLAC_04383 [Tieghemostelium lacteum]|uniref:F-box domain-containing protein n=1 Tax=Tieghemostelium lacteum TaxID=361077 RepID=A0A151ZJD1_TIELA|nr:hypothetical protein DLAC_04383 [Tieghemostelium lacteum]|eukprot:KYQ94102.1 hypothetical protein DLAC_04383 [Tieghemostelium lacteum]